MGQQSESHRPPVGRAGTAGAAAIVGAIIGATLGSAGPGGSPALAAPVLDVRTADAALLPGQSGTIEIWYDDLGTGLVHDSAVLRLLATAEGVRLDGYAWGGAYQTGSIFDGTAPGLSDWPIFLDDDLLAGSVYPPGVADIEFSNFTGGGAFAGGLLLTVAFTIPADWSGPSQIVFAALPDTFARGFAEFEVDTGAAAAVAIVPAPAGAALLSLLIVGPSVRRRVRVVSGPR
jgi:hypothetical protein